MFVGIDVSATRGFDVCVLDESRTVSLQLKARDLETLEPILRGFPKTATFAVDAPSAVSKGLVTGKEHRVAEHELRKLSITLYFTPRSEDVAPAWMRAGFALYHVLDSMGFPVFGGGEAGSGLTIEVYPHLSYVSLTGNRRGSTSKVEWSRAALRGRVHGLPPSADQDALDAACAALTAWTFVNGRWVAYGDPVEGLIVAPHPKTDLGRVPTAGHNQLTLSIESVSAPRAISSPQASTFAERVASVVSQIPAGLVATYGDVARWAGKPAGARAVGTVLKTRQFELPCHRVVDTRGEPPPYPEDASARLRAEGVAFDGSRVDLASHRWQGPR
jgi:methylated-DNA-protein-cysteine methyltransferase related protein